MKGSGKIAIFTNAVLLLLVLVVGAVCFFPLGVSTAGKISDRVYYSGNRESNKISLM